MLFSAFVIISAILITSGLTIASPQIVFGQISPEDILVLDGNGGTLNRGVLFIVDPSTGFRTIFSDLGDTTQGQIVRTPDGIVFDASGNILLLNRQNLLSVDATSGFRTSISSFANPSQGPLTKSPRDLAIDASGKIIVIDPVAGTNGKGALFSVDPVTGFRTIVSDFGDPSQGPSSVIVGQQFGVDIDLSGSIYVTDGFGITGRGVLFSIDPVTGFRTIVSDFGDPSQGSLGRIPFKVNVDDVGKIIVTDINAGTNFKGALFSVDPVTGFRTTVTDVGNPTQGPIGGFRLNNVDVDASGNIYATDSFGTTSKGALFSVDPVTGFRTIVSDFGDPTQGQTGFAPRDVAVATLKTPIEQIENLIEEVLDLPSQSNLKNNQINGLLAKLNVAIDSIQAEEIQDAISQLGAFINQVNAFVNSGKITVEQGQSLIDQANAVIAALQE